MDRQDWAELVDKRYSWGEMAGPLSYQPQSAHQAPLPAAPKRRTFSALALAGTAAGAFLLGIIVAVATTWLLLPQLHNQPASSASASASASPPPSAPPTASETAAAAPAIDPAAAARARKLARLRTKVKAARAPQLDAQCSRFKQGFGTGYVYDGGTFAENEFVANASGCVALAKASKAPWFCCPK